MFSSSRTFSFDESAVIDYLRNPDIECVKIEDKKIKATVTYCCENYITYLFSYTSIFLDEKEEYYANLQMWNWKEKSYIELIDLELEEILAFFFPLEMEIKEPEN